VKQILGVVDNVCVLERESFAILFSDLKETVHILKAVRLHLKDYKVPTAVDLVKVSINEVEMVVVSETLSY
jgi:hypothetical protein